MSCESGGVFQLLFLQVLFPKDSLCSVPVWVLCFLWSLTIPFQCFNFCLYLLFVLMCLGPSSAYRWRSGFLPRLVGWSVSTGHCRLPFIHRQEKKNLLFHPNHAETLISQKSGGFSQVSSYRNCFLLHVPKLCRVEQDVELDWSCLV